MDYSFNIAYPDDHSIVISNITNEHMNDIPELSSNITRLVISHDYIDHYSIPQGIDTATLTYLGLKTLYVPDGVKYLYCCHNFLRKLELPSSIVHVIANNNLLTEVTFRGFPKDLYYLDIRTNRICYLDIPISKSLEYLNAAFNPCVQELCNENSISTEVQEYLRSQHIPHIYSESDDDDNWADHLYSNFGRILQN